jgi:riboflavin synthase
MFTGIISAIGKIITRQPRQGDIRLTIATGKLSLDAVRLGDSIAVNGVCLTVIKLGAHTFEADVSNESLTKTTLNKMAVGDLVNLELALTLATRLGGHLVSGHVDGLATVIEKKADARSIVFKFKVPTHLAQYIAEKGSVCINGISLTVNEVEGVCFSVNIVPYTLTETTLNQCEISSKVNIEVDLLARYLERLMTTNVKEGSPISRELLQQSGFSA